MSHLLLPIVVRHCCFRLFASLVLATAVASLPAEAHIGVSEEIEEVTARIENDPNDPELYLLRGDLYRMNGHWSDAIAEFKKAQQLDHGTASAELGIGRTLFDQGEYAPAVVHLSRALAHQPDDVRSLVTRAKAFRLLGDPLAAAADYARAIDAFNTPSDPLPEYYFERARAFEAAGGEYMKAAIQTLDAGIKRLGSIRILEDYAVELECNTGNYTTALLRLNRIIDQSLRKEYLLVKRGDILRESGKFTQAAADYTAARAAIDALPAQRRYSRAMQQLRFDIEKRLHSLKLSDGGR